MAEAELVAVCHCGRATIRLPRKPDYVNHCNCTLCTAIGFWGIYYPSDELTIDGDFDSYVRNDLRTTYLRVLRCATCGTPTHWMPLGEPPYERMGVNARLVDPVILEGVEVREIDGRSWDE
ncbi:MAG TPA: GFA family protein [Sphingomicrobium sp.]|nr:GFA family protein [Sphingomicrobium sp.]